MWAPMIAWWWRYLNMTAGLISDGSIYWHDFLNLPLVLLRGVKQQPPNSFRPGAQNRAAKRQNCYGNLQVHPFPSFWRKNFEPTTYTRGSVSFQSWDVRGVGAIPWFLNWIILKIFEVICTPNFVCKLEWPVSNIFCKKSHENRMFLRFFT